MEKRGRGEEGAHLSDPGATLSLPPCLGTPGCTLELEGTLGTVLWLQFFVIQGGPGTQSGLRDSKLLSDTWREARSGSVSPWVGKGHSTPIRASLSTQVRKDAT